MCPCYDSGLSPFGSDCGDETSHSSLHRKLLFLSSKVLVVARRAFLVKEGALQAINQPSSDTPRPNGQAWLQDLEIIAMESSVPVELLL